MTPQTVSDPTLLIVYILAALVGLLGLWWLIDLVRTWWDSR